MSSRPNSLQLNPDEARWLGVCAGIADWLDLPIVLIRIVFIICVISWPPLILVYLGLYFCLDRKIRPENMREYFENATTAEHFKNLDYRKPIYKNESNKRIAGVCAGIGDYLEVSPFFVRVVALLLLFTIAGPYAILAYIICMVAFDPDPYAPAAKNGRRQRRSERRAERRERRDARRAAKNEYRRARAEQSSMARESEREQEDADSFEEEDYEARAQEPSRARNAGATYRGKEQCAEIYNSLEMRLREIEAYMTSKKFRLHCEIKRI